MSPAEVTLEKTLPNSIESERAVLRFARFPSISELYDIAEELKHQAEIKVNSEWIMRMHEEWNLRQGEEKREVSGEPGARALK